MVMVTQTGINRLLGGLARTTTITPPPSIPDPRTLPNEGLDDQVVNLAKAIRDHETGNRPVRGASGELASRYQFMPGTWKERAGKYLGDSNAPVTLENENKAMYAWIAEQKAMGRSPAQIAAMHNSGSPEWEGKVGVNSKGVRYDVPAYVQSVYSKYRQYQYGDSAFDESRLNAPAATVAEPKSAKGFAKNALKSSADFIASIAGLAAHPIQTAKGIGTVALGAAEKLLPGEQGQEYAANALGKHYKDRYGGLSNIGNTLYQDPIGFLADLSTLAGGGAAGLKLAGAITKSSKLAKAAETASTISRVTDPLKLPANALRGAATRGGIATKLESKAEGLMRSSFKPTKAIEKAHPNVNIPRAALEEGVTLSNRSLDRMSGQIDDVNNAIGEKISAAAEAGKTVDPYAVASRVDDLKTRVVDQVSPQQDLATIASKQADFLNHPKYSEVSKIDPTMRVPKPIRVDEAQALKRGTYRELRGKFGQERAAGIEAEKALARGLKEEIAKAVPEIAELNAKDTRLIALEDALTEALRRKGNRDVLSLKNMIGLAATPWNWGTLVASVIDDPSVKSVLAQIMYRASKGVSKPLFPVGHPGLRALNTLLNPLSQATKKTVLVDNEGLRE